MVSQQPLVLDASALMAIITSENGANAVEQILKTGDALVNPITLTETYGSTRRRLGMRCDDIATALFGLGLRIEELLLEDAAEIAFIQERADAASKTIGVSKQLSVADTACLAVGRRLGAKVIFFR